jgi:hypothetical protein
MLIGLYMKFAIAKTGNYAANKKPSKQITELDTTRVNLRKETKILSPS